MVLQSTPEIVNAAAAVGKGIGAFNVIQIELAEALTAGATDVGAPVILQISENAVKYHGSLAPIANATLTIAQQSPTPVAVHLDHAENVRVTAEVALHCHEHGVGIEAELGEVGGKDGVHAPGVRTNPQEAAAFVGATGVDALAVAVGSSHAMTSRDAQLDFELISRIRETVPVPLVLHGSSGVADEHLTRAVEAGMTKVNISTHLNHAFTDTVRAVLAENPELVDTRKYLGPAREAVRHEVSRLLGILNAI